MSAKIILLLCVLVCHQGTGTSRRPTFCVYNNQRFERRSTFQAERCIEGYCDDSGNVTLTPTCCVYQNQTYELSSDFQVDQCTYGYCSYDGNVYTNPVDCPQDPCPQVYVEGECCPQCPVGWEPTCTFEGETYKAGPIPTSDPCQTCECPDWGGDPECIKQDCDPCASTEDTISKPGQCCPECQPKS